MAGKDCPMCEAIGAGDNDFTVSVADGAFAEVRLERRSALPGYCIVVWKHRHVAEPTELDVEEALGYWEEVLAVGRAVLTRFSPIKVNYLTLGNTVPHLHTHVVPRYPDDPAPAGPLPWEALFSDDPLPDATLHEQATDLRRLISGRG